MNRSLLTFNLLFMSCILFTSVGCEKEKVVLENKGTPTVIQGRVTDDQLGISMEGVKMVFVKYWTCCSNFMCGTCTEDVATAYTDAQGNYRITFNYYLNEGESYGLSPAYGKGEYNFELKEYWEVLPGQVNIFDMNAWKAVIVTLTVDVRNNIHPPLRVGINADGGYKYGPAHVYNRDTIVTLPVYTRPKSNVTIDFWYNENEYSTNSILHKIRFPYETSVADTAKLSFVIDCATF